MKNIALYIGALLLLLGMLQSVQGVSISPLFSGITQKCVQLNESYISCPDGANITLTFSASAPYAPYYGNFTVYPTDFANESMPTNIYGRICSVPSSSTVTCFMTIKPISLFSGNGTASRKITLLLVSENYPQVRFEQYFNITIEHYQSPFGYTILSIYRGVNSTYVNMSSVYNYFCSTYEVCNSSLGSSLYYAGSEISKASASISNSSLQQAYAELMLANTTLTNSEAEYSSFVSMSNKISNNIIKAKYLIANATDIYLANAGKLSNCTFLNGTSYANYINSSIKSISSYSMLNTLQSSSAYLNASSKLLNNETSLVRVCYYKSNPIALPKISIPSGTVLLYVAIVIIAIFAIYAISRAREYMIFKTEKESAEVPPINPPSSESAEGQPEGSTESAEPLASEDSFNKWFDSTIKKSEQEPEGKDASPAEGETQQPKPQPKPQPKQQPKQQSKKGKRADPKSAGGKADS
ncbi:MAG: hypothetical protein ACP5K9_02215 [Candidatus Micrarchaeia archaeon]